MNKLFLLCFFISGQALSACTPSSQDGEDVNWDSMNYCGHADQNCRGGGRSINSVNNVPDDSTGR